MDDRSRPDEDLQIRVETLFRLWDLIATLFGELPKPVKVGKVRKAHRQWVANPPTRNIVPRLITRTAMQPLSLAERVLIMDGLTAWSDAFNLLIALAALQRVERPEAMYLEATKRMDECAEKLRIAASSIRRHMKEERQARGRHRGE
ncbi:MAG: hypothetical protein ACRDPY_26785 [Streptosporangiaceae bacterium]